MDSKRSCDVALQPLVDGLDCPAAVVEPGYHVLAANMQYRTVYAAGASVDGRCCYKRNAGKAKWHKMPYVAVIAYAENERKAQVWMQENWAKVTKKPTVQDMKQVLAATEQALDVYNLDME